MAAPAPLPLPLPPPAPSFAPPMLSASDYQALSRLLPHMSAEVIARRIVSGRWMDFKLSELKVIIHYFKEHLYACCSDDTQLLTDRGFLFIDKLKQRLPSLRVACYDVQHQTLQYHAIDEDDLIDRRGMQRLVRFICTERRVDLLVTAEHDMYARTGRREGDVVEWEKEQGFDKVQAGELVPGVQDNSRVIQLLAHALNGVDQSALQSVCPFDELRFTSSDQCDAFLEMYGCWLNSGQLDYSSSSILLPRTADCNFLLHLFHRLADALTVRLAQRDEPHFVITSPHCWRVFSQDRGAPLSPPSPTRTPSSTSSPRSPSCLHAAHDDEEEVIEDDHDAGQEGPRVHSWVLQSLTKSQLRLILNGLRWSQGDRRPAGEAELTGSISTQSAHFRDQMTVLLLHAGYSSSFTFDSATRRWVVHYSALASSTHPTLSQLHVSQHCRHARVWCVTVPHKDHLIVVRRAQRGAEGAVLAASQPVVVGNCNPHWSRIAGTKKEVLVAAIKQGLDWMKKNAAAIAESQQQQRPPGTNPPAANRYPAAQSSSIPGQANPASGNPASYSSFPPLSHVPSSLHQNGYPSSSYPSSGNHYMPAYLPPNSMSSNAYHTERKENGFLTPSSSSSSSSSYNGLYRPSLPSSSSTAELPPILLSPNFRSGRSPYEEVVSILAYATLSPQPTSSSTCRTYCSFVIPPATLLSLKRSKSSSPSDLYSVHVRLFSTFTMSHSAFDKSFRVKLNAHDVVIPEPKKLSKTKKKGIELIRALSLTDFCTNSNYLEIESVRQSYLTDLFRGYVVIELIKERDTGEIITMIKARQVKDERKGDGGLPSFVIKPKQCSVCASTKELLRCSRCKNEWYCGEEHQREHWAVHRLQCHPPTAEQEREREAYERKRDVQVKQEPAKASKTKLKMPIKVRREAGTLQVDDDVLDDDIAEVDTIVSLKDLVSQERIELAAKGRHCSHLPCFDVSTFLQLSQQSGIWQCPICYVGVSWEDVLIDEEMNTILKEVDEDCSQIRVKPDGSYEAIDSEPQKKKQKLAGGAASSSSSPVSPMAVLSPVASSAGRTFPQAAENGHAQVSPTPPPAVVPVQPDYDGRTGMGGAYPSHDPPYRWPLQAASLHPPVMDSGQYTDFLRADSPALLNLPPSPQPYPSPVPQQQSYSDQLSAREDARQNNSGGGGGVLTRGETLEDAIVIDDD